MKFLDFFSGIGGFRLGMEMAGHECVGHCEIDKYADISYRAMHKVKENEFYANDITRIEPGDLPQADVYCGGFPCQAFSIAGNRGGFADTRGTLFFEVMRLATVRKPKYLFLENVKGLLSHDNGKTFGTIIQSLWECGYDAEWQVCNSKYWVPQNRERIFIVGHIRGQSAGQVFPITEVSGTTNDIQRTSGNQKGINMGLSDQVKPGYTECANTLLARDYKGPKTHAMTFVKVENQCDVIQVNDAQQFGSVPRQQNRIYNTKGISPALTKGFSDTVNIVEPKINQVGMLTGGKWDKMNDQPRRVYGTDGISPSLHTCGGGNLEPKIAIPVLTPDRIEKRQNGRRFKDDGEEMFTLTSQDRHGVLQIREATEKGYAEAVLGDGINIGAPTSGTRRGRIGKGIVNTLTTMAEMGVVVEEPRILRKVRTEHGKAIRKQYESGEVEERRCNMTELEPRDDGISNTISTVEKDNYLLVGEPKIVDAIYNNRKPREYSDSAPTIRADRQGLEVHQNLTIRKLTPRECFRLQGFPDEYFDRAASVNSDSQLYKQAGNSVTVPVIHEIARRLK